MHKETKFGNTTYHAQVRTWTTPIIKEQFLTDEGILTYILENGNTITADRYVAMWMPPKGTINLKGRGERIDNKQRIY